MINRVLEYIKSNNLIEKGDRIIVGVSGGADSVCLLHILYNLYKDTDIELIGVHVHHGIRGDDANNDEVFVKKLCHDMSIKLRVYHYDVVQIAKDQGLSEEEAGRKIRYKSFVKAAKESKCNKVAIAHNKNDNAETFLFNLFRGSGIKGLTGIEPMVTMKTDVGNGTFIRPLLFVSREEIEDYLSKEGVEYQTDLTNLSDLYTRNKIRNRVLSYVNENVNSKATQHITNAAKILAETYRFIDRYSDERFSLIVKKSDKSYEYLINELEKEDIVIQKEIIIKIIGKLAGKLKDIESKHIEDVLALGKRQVGRYINLPYGIIALKEYDIVRIYIKQDQQETNHERDIEITPVKIKIPGRTYIKKQDIYIATEVHNYNKNQPFPKNSCMKWFDYDKIENTLTLRTRKTGDYLQINSWGGRKKLKDYFIDIKIPKEERDSKLLVADGNHILWVIGNGDRISERYKINDNTNHILSMRLINSKENNDDR